MSYRTIRGLEESREFLPGMSIISLPLTVLTFYYNSVKLTFKFLSFSL